MLVDARNDLAALFVFILPPKNFALQLSLVESALCPASELATLSG
jgi:hypothetical protein